MHDGPMSNTDQQIANKQIADGMDKVSAHPPVGDWSEDMPAKCTAGPYQHGFFHFRAGHVDEAAEEGE